MIQKLRNTLLRTSFARSASVLAGGTAAGQAIMVAASPALTRLYTPSDFGILAVFTALVGIFGVIATLRYALAIPLPERDEDAVQLVPVSILAALAVSLLVSIPSLIWPDAIAELLNTPEMADFLWLVPLGVLAAGLYQVINYWAIRNNSFSRIARSKLVQAISMTTVQMTAYLLGPLALLAGRVLGQFASIIDLAKATFADNENTSACSPAGETSVAGMRTQAYEYRHFPMISTWTGLASSTGMHLTPLLVITLMGTSAAGFFALTHRVLSTPMTVIGKAVGDVFYREAVKANRSGDLGELVTQTNERLIAAAMPATILGMLIAPSAFQLVFGKDWETAGVVAQCIAPWLFFQFITTPPTRIYPILGRHKSALAFQLSLALSSAIAITAGATVFGDLTAAMILLATGNSTIYAVRLFTSTKLAGASPLTPLGNLAKHGALGMLACAPLIVTQSFGTQSQQGPFVWITAALASFIAVLYLFYRAFLTESHAH